ncbi:hypothetical protein BC834DRAFT_387214 [Gloeopeniophorella convolvens]|nr:hypothetical protein BC834DRAFT_387214 [Gloeopeniophorella convolvens]
MDEPTERQELWDMNLRYPQPCSRSDEIPRVVHPARKSEQRRQLALATGENARRARGRRGVRSGTEEAGCHVRATLGGSGAVLAARKIRWDCRDPLWCVSWAFEGPHRWDLCVSAHRACRPSQEPKILSLPEARNRDPARRSSRWCPKSSRRNAKHALRAARSKHARVAPLRWSFPSLASCQLQNASIQRQPPQIRLHLSIS